MTGKYILTPPTLEDGMTAALLLDSGGRLLVSSPTGASSNQVQGNVAHDAVDSGNPVKVGGVAITSGSPATAVAAGDRVNATFTRNGALVASMGSQLPSNTNDRTSVVFALSDNGAYYPLGVQGFFWNGSAVLPALGDTNGAFVVNKPVTSGGLSFARLVGATNGVIKASAGQLYSGTFTNTNAAIRYLQIYNKATAGTLSTDTPALTIPLPPNVSVVVDFAGMGAAFATGISWQFTTDDIAIPTTAGASTDLHGFVTYK